MHRRVRPRHHRFKYRVFAMLMDLNELPSLERPACACSGGTSRACSVSMIRDHGDGRPLNVWLNGLLASAGIASRTVPRRVLCYPRILGYVFNPLSVWFCHDEADALKAVIYEVHNTYEERHAYVFAARRRAAGASHLRQGLLCLAVSVRRLPVSFPDLPAR